MYLTSLVPRVGWHKKNESFQSSNHFVIRRSVGYNDANPYELLSGYGNSLILLHRVNEWQLHGKRVFKPEMEEWIKLGVVQCSGAGVKVRLHESILDKQKTFWMIFSPIIPTLIKGNLISKCLKIMNFL